MKNTFKRTMAALLATATMAVGMGGMSASAYDTSGSWSVRHVNVAGAPGSTGISTTCQLAYSTRGTRSYCNSISNSVNGGNGSIRINCTNYSMSQKTLSNTGSYVDCSPSVSGTIYHVDYKFTGYTSTTNNTFNASGTINNQ